MSRDYAEKEKAFLETLKADTGRDLGEWMEAVTAQGFTQRNDIIDWFRHQGFIFSRASWLERIHHNGGRPIYLREQPADRAVSGAGREHQGGGTGKPALRVVVSNPELPERSGGSDVSRKGFGSDGASGPTLVTGGGLGGEASRQNGSSSVDVGALEPAQESRVAPVVSSGLQAGPRQPLAGAARVSDDLEAALSKAKAFAPLARHVIGQIRATLPDVSLNAQKAQIAFMAPMPFGVLVLSGKGLRLCLNLGDRAYDERVLKTRLPAGLGRVPSTFSHMVVLEDARQVDDALLALVKTASDIVN